MPGELGQQHEIGMSNLAWLSNDDDLNLDSAAWSASFENVIVLQASRIILLKCNLDAAEMHRALHNLSITAFASADDLAHEATTLFLQCPPSAVIHSKHICMSKYVALLR